MKINYGVYDKDLFWEQFEVIHCPNTKCKGMLLQNKFLHAMKCSDCKNFFVKQINFIEINKESLF
jgi:hypothetical protein